MTENQPRMFELDEASSRDSSDSSSMPALLTVHEVAAIFKVSVRTIQRRRAAGDLPKPISIGPRMIRWRADEIEAWIRSLGAGSTRDS